MRDSKVKVEGKCEFAPNVLGIMDTIILSIRYIAHCKKFIGLTHHVLYWLHSYSVLFC